MQVFAHAKGSHSTEQANNHSTVRLSAEVFIV